MQYETEVLDPETGEITTTTECWLTITEYGRTKGVGPRQVRAVLSGLGLLQQEIEVRMVHMIVDRSQTKPDYRATKRLTSDAVIGGLGRRIFALKTDMEFDVLSPKGQRWADERWPVKKAMKTTVKQEIAQLLDLRPNLSQAQVQQITGRSKQLVSYHMQKLTA